MAFTKKQKIFTGVAAGVVALVAIIALGVPAYQRRRIGNVQTAIDAVKLAADPKVVQVIGKFPTAAYDMTNKEVRDMYKYLFTYLQKGIAVPSDLKSRIDAIFAKYFV